MYVTVRILETGFFVNEINEDGTDYHLGNHSYHHKRSARRAAKALANKKTISYRQDLEYSDEARPQATEIETVNS